MSPAPCLNASGSTQNFAWLPDSPSDKSSWIDALCINQYDEAEKERQVRNMFHIYRKASTVLVWLGLAGPGTCLGADIVNVYDMIWQDNRNTTFSEALKLNLGRKAYCDNDASLFVDEFLNDLREKPGSDDERGGADTLGLVSMALDGIADILGRAWIRRTWIIQELAAATNVKFQCGRSVLSYDGFFDVIPYVGNLLWQARSFLLAGEEDLTISERLRKRPRSYSTLFPSTRDIDVRYDGPPSFRESLPFTEVLHQLRLLVNDPGRMKSRRTQTELLLVFLVETVSRGFDVSIGIDRVYSLMAMADAISSGSWGLTHSKRKPSSPQQLPVDYSVGLQAAVLRLLKIRMNEVKDFYVAVESLFLISKSEKDYEKEDWKTKSILFSVCSAYSSPPSWLKLLEFDENHLDRYVCKSQESQRKLLQVRSSWGWAEQDVTEPDTLVMRGKALGRLSVDSEGQPSRIWVELPCPLGQEFETCYEYHKPVRALSQGCPDERPAAGHGSSLDDTETGGEREEPSEQRTALNNTGTFFWRWQFPLHARDGDVVVVFPSGCALLRSSHGGRYILIEKGLRKAVVSSEGLTYDLERNFITIHQEDLDTFVLI